MSVWKVIPGLVAGTLAFGLGMAAAPANAAVVSSAASRTANTGQGPAAFSPVTVVLNKGCLGKNVVTLSGPVVSEVSVETRVEAFLLLDGKVVNDSWRRLGVANVAGNIATLTPKANKFVNTTFPNSSRVVIQLTVNEQPVGGVRIEPGSCMPAWTDPRYERRVIKRVNPPYQPIVPVR